MTNLYMYINKGKENQWFDENNTLTSSKDNTKYCLSYPTQDLPNNSIIEDNFKKVLLDSNIDSFPNTYMANNDQKAIIINKMLYNYIINNGINFSIKSYITTLINDNITSLRYDFWRNNFLLKKPAYTDVEILTKSKSDGFDIYKTSILLASQKQKYNYIQAWPLFFLYDENNLESDTTFLLDVIKNIDNTDKAMFIFVHAPAFYGDVIPGTNWKTTYMSRAEYAYDNYEEMIKVTNPICKTNFKIFMDHTMGQLICNPSTYTVCANSESKDIEYSSTAKQNFSKITSWIAVRTVKSVLLRVKNIDEEPNVRSVVLNYFNDETKKISDWTLEYVNYFAENAISMPYEFSLFPFQRSLIIEIFQNADSKYRINMLYRYNCVFKGYIGVDTSAVYFTVPFTDETKYIINGLIDGMVNVDPMYRWRKAPIISRESDFELFWSINGTLFNTNSEYVSTYINRRLLINDKISENLNNQGINIKLFKNLWIQYKELISSIEAIQQISDKLYQNNYNYTCEYIDSFYDPFICALALMKFSTKINKDSSISFIYSIMAIYDYIISYGYTIDESKYKTYSQGMITSKVNAGKTSYFMNGKPFIGDILAAQVHAHILTVFESNDEWKMKSGKVVEDFYNVYKYSPNVTNAKLYMENMIIKYDNERIDATKMIVNFVVSNNYQETKPIMVKGISSANLMSILPTLTHGTLILMECRYKNVSTWSNAKYLLGIVAENGDILKGLIPRVRMLYFSDDTVTWKSVENFRMNAISINDIDGNTMTLSSKVLREGNYAKILKKSVYKINEELVTLNPGDYLLFLYNSWKILTNTKMDEKSQMLWPIVTNKSSVIYNNIWTCKDYTCGYISFSDFINRFKTVKRGMEHKITLPSKQVIRGMAPDIVDILENSRTIEDAINKYDTYISNITTRGNLGTNIKSTISDINKTKTNPNMNESGYNFNCKNLNELVDIVNNMKVLTDIEEENENYLNGITTRSKMLNILNNYGIKLESVIYPQKIQKIQTRSLKNKTRELSNDLNDLMEKYVLDLLVSYGIDYKIINSDLMSDLLNNFKCLLYYNYAILKNYNPNTSFRNIDINKLGSELSTLNTNYPHIQFCEVINSNNDTEYKIKFPVLTDDIGVDISNYEGIKLYILEDIIAEALKTFIKSDKLLFTEDEIKRIRDINNIKIYNSVYNFIVNSNEITLDVEDDGILLSAGHLFYLTSLFDIDEFDNFDITIPGSNKINFGEYALDNTCLLYNILKADSYDVAFYLANQIQLNNAHVAITGTLDIELPNTEQYIGCIKMACLRDEYYYSWYGFIRISQMSEQEVNYICKNDLVVALNVCIAQGMNKMPYNTIFKNALDSGATRIIQLLISAGFVTNFMKNAEAVFEPLDNSRVNSLGDKSGFPFFTTLSTSNIQLINAMCSDNGERFCLHGSNSFMHEYGMMAYFNKRCADYFLIKPASQYLSRKIENTS